ncbi:hypothetical protein LEP1GSC058_2075 [Leptospira fainei serovar Hurstbridge str. BUT 6]|uniref:Uncharacterized protein n=1 Tax=Leptospira fainei serovar Hurstbridge str. BUT 6 TaxID=1193011 RepID=S3UXW6_9LEPT|nr:hypothetical protein LEP1GSC058_2075 [Leptospira fainei serovar Hurstbridge str. BUT 6]
MFSIPVASAIIVDTFAKSRSRETAASPFSEIPRSKIVSKKGYLRKSFLLGISCLSIIPQDLSVFFLS